MRTENTSGGANSGTAKLNPAAGLAADCHCELSGDCFWALLAPDREHPGKLIAKDYDGRVVFLARDSLVPAGWKAGDFVLLQETLRKPKFRVASPARYTGEGTAEYQLRMLFDGVFDATFAEPNDKAVLAWLDAKTMELWQSPQVAEALANIQRRLERELAEAEAAAKREAQWQAQLAGLSPAAQAWATRWRDLDWTAGYSDDSMCETRHQTAKARLLAEAITAFDEVECERLEGVAYGRYAKKPHFEAADSLVEAFSRFSGAEAEIVQALANTPFRSQALPGHREYVLGLIQACDPDRVRLVFSLNWSRLAPRAADLIRSLPLRDQRQVAVGAGSTGYWPRLAD